MFPLTPTDDPNVVSFATAELRGAIESQGECHGFRALEFLPSGSRPANPALYLGHVYRLLSHGRYHMTAREEPHTGRIEPARVVATWEPLAVHPAHIEAVYQVSGEHTLDFTVTVRPTEPLPAYELYLSHYFAPAWRPYVYLQPAPYLRSGEPVLWPCEVNEFIRGVYLAYPRDREAMLTLFDGRWHGDHPVPFAVGRHYHAPVAVYASALEGLAVVATARRSECFCVYGTYDSPDGRDNILHHNSLYFGMFGDDLRPGDERVAHLRYHFVRWDAASDLPLRLWEEWEAGG
ncbi:MAG: hypothetical protein HYU66_28415 [Armatimonadetes bacterium]|nr:hypothetical protein [Armatimonadota bacterium]